MVWVWKRTYASNASIPWITASVRNLFTSKIDLGGGRALVWNLSSHQDVSVWIVKWDVQPARTHVLELGDVDVESSLFERFFCGKDHWFASHFVRHAWDGDSWHDCLRRLCLIAASIECIVAVSWMVQIRRSVSAAPLFVTLMCLARPPPASRRSPSKLSK